MGAIDPVGLAESPRSTNDELEAVLPKDGVPWYKKSYLVKTNICVISLMLFSGSNGFDGSLMNGLLALPQWREFMDSPSGAWLGFINGIYSLGCAIGYPVAAWVSNRYGRKFPVWISLVMCAIGIAVQTSAKDDVSFVVARLFQGFSQGFTLSVPLLIAENAYPTHRGICSAMVCCGPSLRGVIRSLTYILLDSIIAAGILEPSLQRGPLSERETTRAAGHGECLRSSRCSSLSSVSRA
jgi:MFS family permease